MPKAFNRQRKPLEKKKPFRLFSKARLLFRSPKIRQILSETKTIAVVGCSTNPLKPAFQVPEYLQKQGYKIMPVNPRAETLLGEKPFKSLAEIRKPVDMVLVFRPSREVSQILIHALELKPKTIWMQLGIEDKASAKIASKNGIKVVMNKCIMKEHKKETIK